jgi:hypothetical protein
MLDQEGIEIEKMGMVENRLIFLFVATTIRKVRP